MSKTLSNPEAKAVTKEEDFSRKSRIQPNSPYMTKTVSNCSTPTREEFGTTDYAGDSTVHLKKLPSVSKEEFPHTTLSSPERETIIQKENFFELERSRAYSSPPCMVRRRVTDGISRILLLI